MQRGFESGWEGRRIYGDVLNTAEPDPSPCGASAVHRLIGSHLSTQDNREESRGSHQNTSYSGQLVAKAPLAPLG